MTRPRILLLIPSTSYKVADFLDAASRLDVDVAVGSERRHVLEAYSNGGTLTVDFRDVKMGVRDVRAYAAVYPLRAILGVDERTAVLAATASQALGLPHNAPEAVAATADKFRFREAMAKTALLSPSFFLLEKGADAETSAISATYPCVLKPLMLSASRGVIRADNAEEFTAAYRRIARILDDSGDHQEILVEGYIPGTEVALEGLLDNGDLTVLALFDKPDPLHGPYFEETIYLTPSRLSPARQLEIGAAARTASAALGLRDGPIHAEFRLNEDGVWIIELGARSIGGLCGRTLQFGAGLSLETVILRQALGLPATAPARHSQAAGVMMIPIPAGGILRSVDGVLDARAVDGIDDVTISIPVGDLVVPLPEGDRYLGFIFARGETPDDAERALRQSNACLRFEIEAASPGSNSVDC